MAITNGYTTLANVKSHLGIGDTNDDTELEAAIETASRKIDEHCGRRFWRDSSDVTRYFTPTNPRTLWLGPHIQTADVATVTTLKVDTTGNGTYDLTLTEGTDFFLAPKGNPDSVFWRVELVRSTWRCWPDLPDSVEIVGTFGINGAPTNVAEACVLQASKLFQVAKDGGGGLTDQFQGGSVRETTANLQSRYLERSAEMLLVTSIHPTRRVQVA